MRSVTVTGTTTSDRASLVLDPEAPEWVRRRHMDTARVLDTLDPVMAFRRFLHQQPEGSRVKVTIEAIWTPEVPQ